MIRIRAAAVPHVNFSSSEHIGSFLRPAELLDARQQAHADPERVRALEDAHIKRVISRQKELGFQVFTDGETRRSNFMSDFTEAVAGFDLSEMLHPRSWFSELDTLFPPANWRRTAIPETEDHEDAECKPRCREWFQQSFKPMRRFTGHELSFLLQHSPGTVGIDFAQRYPVSGNFF